MESNTFNELVEIARRRDGDRGGATLAIGHEAIFSGPCALIEWWLKHLNQALRSDLGYSFVHIPYKEINKTVLVSAATPIVATWPEGYEPFAEYNPLLEEFNNA